MAPQLDAYFKQVDSLSDAFIERLRKAVAIPSVSAEDERRPEVIKVKTCACISQTYYNNLLLIRIRWASF
jgi:hypothetical protein